MAIEVFNRYEHKYMLDKQAYESVINVLQKHMELDFYNKDYTPYTIANIYFDTDGDYKAVFITSPLLKSGKTYTVSAGSEVKTAELSEQVKIFIWINNLVFCLIFEQRSYFAEDKRGVRTCGSDFRADKNFVSVRPVNNIKHYVVCKAPFHRNTRIVGYIVFVAAADFEKSKTSPYSILRLLFSE